VIEPMAASAVQRDSDGYRRNEKLVGRGFVGAAPMIVGYHK